MAKKRKFIIFIIHNIILLTSCSSFKDLEIENNPLNTKNNTSISQVVTKVEKSKEAIVTNSSIGLKSSNTNATKTKKRKASWETILVNKDNPIPKNYSFNKLYLDSQRSVDKRIYSSLQKMLNDCRRDGNSPIVRSGFQSHATQSMVFNNEVNRQMSFGYSKSEAYRRASKWIAPPGTSEHETGLALDIVSYENYELKKSQENTRTQKWLMKNSYKYGFILRYKENATHITSIGYEPWHYRYVGVEAAKIIEENNITLEEYKNLYEIP